MGVSENTGSLFGGPENKDPTIESTRLGSPIFGNSHIGFGFCGPVSIFRRIGSGFRHIGSALRLAAATSALAASSSSRRPPGASAAASAAAPGTGGAAGRFRVLGFRLKRGKHVVDMLCGSYKFKALRF